MICPRCAAPAGLDRPETLALWQAGYPGRVVYRCAALAHRWYDPPISIPRLKNSRPCRHCGKPLGLGLSPGMKAHPACRQARHRLSAKISERRRPRASRPVPRVPPVFSPPSPPVPYAPQRGARQEVAR